MQHYLLDNITYGVVIVNSNRFSTDFIRLMNHLVELEIAKVNKKVSHRKKELFIDTKEANKNRSLTSHLQISGA